MLRRWSTSDQIIILQAKWQFTNSAKRGTESKYDSKYLTYYTGVGSTRYHQVFFPGIYEFTEILDNIPQSQVNNCICTLFCALDSSNNPFRFVEADLYYLRLYKGGQIIRNLIPVQRNSDNEVGLWDMEHQVFYTSQGDNPFVAGINE